WHREPRIANRAGGGLYRRNRNTRPGRRIADAGLWRAGISGRDQAEISLSRSSPRSPSRKYYVARQSDRFDPPPDEGERFLRIPDTDSHCVVAGRRTRLSGAFPIASRKILRAAAGAAAIQAAHHG